MRHRHSPPDSSPITKLCGSLYCAVGARSSSAQFICRHARPQPASALTEMSWDFSSRSVILCSRGGTADNRIRQLRPRRAVVGVCQRTDRMSDSDGSDRHSRRSGMTKCPAAIGSGHPLPLPLVCAERGSACRGWSKRVADV